MVSALSIDIEAFLNCVVQGSRRSDKHSLIRKGDVVQAALERNKTLKSLHLEVRFGQGSGVTLHDLTHGHRIFRRMS